MSISFDDTAPRAQEAARRQGAKLVTVVGGETKEAINRAISESVRLGVPPAQSSRTIVGILTDSGIPHGGMVGLTVPQVDSVWNFRQRLLDDGLPLDKVDKQVDRLQNRYRRQRSRVVARTETMDALERGKLVGWEQAQDRGLLGPQARKRWVASDPCPICTFLHGQRVPLRGVFMAPPGIANPSMPTVHPNDECSVVLEPLSKEKRAQQSAVAEGIPGYMVVPPHLQESVAVVRRAASEGQYIDPDGTSGQLLRRWGMGDGTEIPESAFSQAAAAARAAKVRAPARPIPAPAAPATPKSKPAWGSSRLENWDGETISTKDAGEFGKRATKFRKWAQGDIDRMRGKYPAMADYKLRRLTMREGDTFRSGSGDAHGTYSYAGRKTQRHEIKIAVDRPGDDWLIAQSEWTVNQSVFGTFRHETGHSFYYAYTDDAARAEWNGIWKSSLDTDSAGRVVKRGRWGDHPISTYGETNPSEYFAEAFSAYTHPDYSPGVLPADVTAFMDDLMSRPATLNPRAISEKLADTYHTTVDDIVGELVDGGR